MIRRALLLVLASTTLVLGASSGSALAIPNPIPPGVPIVGGSDCKTPPSVIKPGDGITGFFEARPVAKDWKTANPADPKALFDAYGYGGMRWNTYDLGCALNPENLSGETTATGGTAFANWLFNAPQFLVAASASVLRFAFKPSWLKTFDPLLTDLTQVMRNDLYDKWIIAALGLVGLLLLWRAHRGNISEAASVAFAALAVLSIGIAVFSYPLRAGHFADNAMTTGVSQASSISAGADNDPATDYERDMYNDVIYPFWVAGELGSATSPTAVTYGPQILAATTFSWAELAQCEPITGTVGPIAVDGCASLAAAKSAKFKTIAAKIHDTDPDAYAALTGHNSDQRVGWALLALVGTLILVPFLVMAGLLVIASYIIIRIAVMTSPVLTVIGVRFPKAARLALQSVAAAIVNSIAFGLAAAVMCDVIGVTLRPGTQVPTWLGLALSCVFGLVVWQLLKPFRKLTSMVSGQNLVADASGVLPGMAKRAASGARSLAGQGIRAYTGGVIAGHVAADEITEAEDSRRERDETTVLNTPDPTAGKPQDGPQRVATALEAPAPQAAADSAAAASTAPASPGFVPTDPAVQPGPDTPALATPGDQTGDTAPAVPVDPSPDGTYEVYRPEQTPPGMTPAPVSDDGTFTVYDPRAEV